MVNIFSNIIYYYTTKKNYRFSLAYSTHVLGQSIYIVIYTDWHTLRTSNFTHWNTTYFFMAVKYNFFIFSRLWIYSFLKICIIFNQYFPVFHYFVYNKWQYFPPKKYNFKIILVKKTFHRAIAWTNLLALPWPKFKYTWWRTTRCCYILNIKALGLVATDKKFLKFSYQKSILTHCLQSWKKSTRLLAMASASCCRMSRKFGCFQCQLLNLPINMVM